MSLPPAGAQSLSPDLLKPSLGSTTAVPSLYSTSATFWVAFLGGPYAAVLFAAQVERHLGKLRKSAWLYLLALAGVVLFQVLKDSSILPQLGIHLNLDRRADRYVGRAFGLLLWGLFYLRHRPFLQMAELQGLPKRKAWRDGLLTVLVSVLLAVVVALAVKAAE